MKNIPEKIYLNLGEDCPADVDFRDLSEVTWSETKVFPNDIEYARKTEWVSVNERLPEDERYFYLVADVRMNPLGVDCAEYTYETHVFSRNGQILHPTHWCPIPPLNTEKGESK